MNTLPPPLPTTAPENSPANGVRQDLSRTTLAVMCLLLLIATTLSDLRPFLTAGIWATMVVVSTWPLLKSVQARLGNRRAPAVALMTLGLLLLLILPLWAAIDTIARHADDASARARSMADSGLPPPPAWVGGVPVVGEKIRGHLGERGRRRSRRPRRPAGAACRGRREVGTQPRRQRWRHAGPLPHGRDLLLHPVRRWRNSSPRRPPFRPAPGGRARRKRRGPGGTGHSGRRAGGRRDRGRPDGTGRHRPGGGRGPRRRLPFRGDTDLVHRPARGRP